MTSISPRQSISRIDKDIDAIHRQLRRLEKIDPYSADSWQDAWDKHPELRMREHDLYRQRGIAQQERDTLAAKDWAREQRRRRSKKPRFKECPTCGAHTFAEVSH